MDEKPEFKLSSNSDYQLKEIGLFTDGVNNLDNSGDIEVKPNNENKTIVDNLGFEGGCERQNLVEIRELLIKLGREVLKLTANLDRANEIIKERDIKLAENELELAKAKQEIYISNLTKLPNKKYFDEIYKVEKFNPDHDCNNIALIYVDINNLKEVNDTIGHDAGDQLIKNVAGFLKESFRPEDIIIHLHGDEFVVVCRNRNGIDEAKLRARVDEVINLAKNKANPLKIAAGVAVFDDKIHDDKIDLDLNDTEHRADQEMHKVKLAMGAGR